jgi:GT2 family glycosyltransferase
MTASAAAPDITVSIVSFNTRDYLRDCLSSLFAIRDSGEVTLEVIVADNGSTDGSKEMVHEDFPDVVLVDPGGNVGYGRGNNAAIAAASGRYYLVLNSDTAVPPGALAALRDYLDNHPKVGMAGPQLLWPDGGNQPSCSTDPPLSVVFWEQTFLHKLIPGNKATSTYQMTGLDATKPQEVDQICGASFFVRKEAWEAIGGFDPEYFMYFEDIDFCIRLRRAGWPIVFLPQARITHHLGASSQKDWRVRARMIASHNQSRYYFYSKNEGKASGAWLKFMVVAGAAMRLFVWSLVSLTGRKSAADSMRMFYTVLKLSFRMRPDTARLPS